MTDRHTIPDFHSQPCWCGNKQLESFHELFYRCRECQTLVCQVSHEGLSRVEDEDADFYGLNYWHQHQEHDLGLPTIDQRARLDLTGRAIYWLKTLLRFERPPARVLEIGPGAGGFLFLLQRAGFEVVGLELSRDIARFASETFGVPVLHGPLHQQDFEPASFDVVVLLDVLEHVPEPEALLAQCRSLLTPSGCLLVQTPGFPNGIPKSTVLEKRDGFASMLIPREHLYLFSRQSLGAILNRVGFEACRPLEPFFDYDLFLVASRQPLDSRVVLDTTECLVGNLQATPDGRLALLLIDLFDRVQELETRATAFGDDRVSLLEQIDDLDKRLIESDTDRSSRLEQIETLTSRLRESEADRAARLDQIQTLESLLMESEADRAARLDQVHTLEALLEESEADRAARLDQIHELTARIEELSRRTEP